MKNFFEQQDRAKLVTNQLIFLFGCAIALTTLIVYGALLCIEVANTNQIVSLFNLNHLMLSGIIVVVGVGVGSYQKSESLKGGGPVVAASLGGVAVDPDTKDPQKQQLLNVVQEMAIAASIPYPKVYVLPDRSINAFAAGHTHKDAVIAVTQGTLDQLNRDELQGVVGHEFSHILNGDMALNLRLIGVVHGLLLMSLAGREILYHTRFGGRKKDGAWVLGLGVGLLVAGAVGWIFGQLIKSAVSRQREFLADASAVQFTRNPEGLTSALMKIAATTGSRSLIASPKAAETSHLFFCPPIKAGFFNAMATHPPLEERIRRLSGQKITRTARSTAMSTASLAGAEGISALAPSSQAMPVVSEPQTAVRSPMNHGAPVTVGNGPGLAVPEHLIHAQALLDELPELLLKAARSQVGAVAVVYSLLLDNNSATRNQQKQLIGKSSPAVLKAVNKIESAVDGVNKRSRLPLLELCIPSLTSLKLSTITQSLKCVQALVRVSGKLSVSEFAIKTVLHYRLAPHFTSNPSPAPTLSSLSDVADECALLISAIAQIGHSKPTDALYALRDSYHQLPRKSRPPIPMELPACSLPALSKAFKRLQMAMPEVKSAIADACIHTVLTDGKTTDSEAELLRAILVALSRPLPSFLDRTFTPSTPRPQSRKAA
ncbi:MAG: M48 family metallopeptidase [Cyanobacteria bacterium J06634_6]